jgi:uncharacterized OB-fold protein
MTSKEQTAGTAPATPAPVGPEKRYFDALNKGIFEIQRCESCDSHVFFPRAMCPRCGSARLTWTAPCGRGTVYSTTTVRRKPEAGGDYNVALIDLDEGVRLMSRVDGVRATDVTIGMQVEAQVRQADGKGVLLFVPRGN